MQKIGRNDPCWCGSGKKYKDCHIELEEKLTRLDLQEARTLQREQAHDEQIARDLAGVPGHFAHGLNFYKLFWVFFLCCFLGVVIETIFFWIASGRLSAPASCGGLSI